MNKIQVIENKKSDMSNYNLILDNGQTDFYNLGSTKTYLVETENGYFEKNISDIEEGEFIVTIDNTTSVKVKTNTLDETLTPVYDIQVDQDSHYILENGVVSHNSGFVFASSIIVSMQKLKLKLDDDGNKITEVRGIRSKIKCIKSRFSKPFEEVELQIPYDTGLSPYSGLFDMFLNKGLLKKEGNRYKFTDVTGKEHLLFRKQYEPEHFELLMDAYQDNDDTGLSVGSELEGLEEE